MSITASTIAEKVRRDPVSDRACKRDPEFVPPDDDRDGVCYSLQSLRTALPLFISDLTSLAGSVLLAYAVVVLMPYAEIHHLPTYLAQVLLMGVILNFSLGLYPGVGLHPACELRALVITVLSLAAISSAAAMMMGSFASPYLALSVLTAFFGLASMFPMRTLTRSLCRNAAWWGHPAVIVGPIRKLPALQRALTVNHFPGIRLIGQFGNEDEVTESRASCCWLGEISEAASFCRKNHVFWVILPKQSLEDDSLEAFSKRLGLRFRQIFVVDDRSVLPNLWGSPVDLGGVAGIHLRERLLMPSHRITKRAFDVAIASLLLLILAPLLVAISVAVKVTSRGPVIFGHRRIGQNGKHFFSLKFRTMVVDAGKVLEQCLANDPQMRKEWECDHKLKNDPRVTCIGTFLRKSSLDELPQLWNVIRGEMSLVGPRPIVDSEIAKYNAVFDSYSRVRPGITGLWQISGRNNTTYEERVAYDDFYIRNWSPWYDLYILMATVKTVVLCKGAY